MNPMPLALLSAESGDTELADRDADVGSRPQLSIRGLEILSTINQVFETLDCETANESVV